MARFRLRFLLQELELTGPTVTIGRSSECQVTLDDPLVSRMHAQITLTQERASVRDLGSRNGVRVNDQLIDGEAPLAHNDRLRLGSQDLVFLVADGATSTARVPRATGAMAHCKQCGRAFPGESRECPRCGTPARVNEGVDTVTDVASEHLPTWTFRLMGEVIERALSAGRLPEAERTLERAARVFSTPNAARRVGREQLSEASRYALRLARASHRPDWAEWAARLYRREQLLPDAEVLDLFEALDGDALYVLRPEFEALLIDREAVERESLGRGGDISEEERARERRLMALVTRTAS